MRACFFIMVAQDASPRAAGGRASEGRLQEMGLHMDRSCVCVSVSVCVCVQCLWLVCGDLCAVEKWLPC